MTTASDNPERPVLLTQLLTLFPGALRALDSVVPPGWDRRAVWPAGVLAMPPPGTEESVAYSSAW